MFTVFLIAFREFFESFLLIGVFFSIAKKLELNRKKEILFGAGIGITIALLLALSVYILGQDAAAVLSEEHSELLENYLRVFSGIFIAYVVITLHRRMKKSDSDKLVQQVTNSSLGKFSYPFFFLVIATILKEGVEIALFTATVALFSDFMLNLVGLFLGLLAASLVGIIVATGLRKLPVRKIFRITEYFIIFLGAAMTQLGITELVEIYFQYDLNNLGSITLWFIPTVSNWISEAFHAWLGLEHSFSLARILLYLLYITVFAIFLNHGIKYSLKKLTSKKEE